MNVKDSVVGTTKKLVAEIVGDGRLAEEGSRQSRGALSTPAPLAVTPSPPHQGPVGSSQQALSDEERFAALLGHAALKVWSDLPREAQEMLFAASVDDGLIANALAVFLHDRHPRTAHPPKPKPIP